MVATLTYIGLAAVIGLLINVGIMAVAFAEPQRPHVWALLVDPSCSLDTQMVKWQMLQQAAYAPYIQNLDVVCMPSVDMLNVKDTAALLRQVYPDDVFVFGFDMSKPANALDWHAVMVSADGRVTENGLGRAFIADGYAIAALNSVVMAHESTHLTLKAIHPVGSNNENPKTWQPFYH